ncbi:MAG: (d)CMP kinase [Gemmatimonadaceae bacterium]
MIAIDGPAASGKSSTAHWVSQELGFRHVDSGALYRAAAAAALRSLRPDSPWTEAAVLGATSGVTLVAAAGSFAPLIAGCVVDAEIRSTEVTRRVSEVARMAGVRAWVNTQVQAVAKDHDVVVDGRDIGTAVFPDADLKVFLVADPWERARRRLLQRLERRPSDDEIAAETERLVQRDARDALQTVQARDAVLIDTTYLTQEEQVARIVSLAHAVTHRYDSTSPVDGNSGTG